jgi:hypothetical protein
MMNNLHYMVKTVESSEALTVLGEEWIEQHKDQVRPCCRPCCMHACSPSHNILLLRPSQPPVRGSSAGYYETAAACPSRSFSIQPAVKGTMPPLPRGCVLQVEEYGEHYQRLAWGLALDIMSADANDADRRDKVHKHSVWRSKVG